MEEDLTGCVRETLREGGAWTVPGFEIGASVHGQRCTFALAGEMDLASAPGFEAAVRRACAEGARQLVVDLRGLDFLDASGLHAIVFARQECAAHGCDFCLVPGRRQLQRLFKISGLLEQLPFREPDADMDGHMQPQPWATARRLAGSG